MHIYIYTCADTHTHTYTHTHTHTHTHTEVFSFNTVPYTAIRSQTLVSNTVFKFVFAISSCFEMESLITLM